MAINNLLSQFRVHFGFHRSYNTERPVSQTAVEKSENQSLISTLPIDILRLIFTFLPTKSALKCTAVCKSWRIIIAKQPQLVHKIKIYFLQIKIDQTMKNPQWFDAEIGINLIELAKMEAISDPKTALLTIEKLQKFMSRRVFFSDQYYCLITTALHVEIAKLQAAHDPIKAVDTIKLIELRNFSVLPLSQYIAEAKTFVDIVRKYTINDDFIKKECLKTHGYIRSFVAQARYKVVYDLNNAQKSLENAKTIISILDTKAEIITEIKEQFSYLKERKEQISWDRAAITKIEMICNSTENTTLESLNYAIDAVETNFAKYRKQYGFKIPNYLT